MIPNLIPYLVTFEKLRHTSSQQTKLLVFAFFSLNSLSILPGTLSISPSREVFGHKGKGLIMCCINLTSVGTENCCSNTRAAGRLFQVNNSPIVKIWFPTRLYPSLVSYSIPVMNSLTSIPKIGLARFVRHDLFSPTSTTTLVGIYLKDSPSQGLSRREEWSLK